MPQLSRKALEDELLDSRRLLLEAKKQLFEASAWSQEIAGLRSALAGEKERARAEMAPLVSRIRALQGELDSLRRDGVQSPKRVRPEGRDDEVSLLKGALSRLEMERGAAEAGTREAVCRAERAEEALKAASARAQAASSRAETAGEALRAMEGRALKAEAAADSAAAAVEDSIAMEGGARDRVSRELEILRGEFSRLQGLVVHLEAVGREKAAEAEAAKAVAVRAEAEAASLRGAMGGAMNALQSLRSALAEGENVVASAVATANAAGDRERATHAAAHAALHLSRLAVVVSPGSIQQQQKQQRTGMGGSSSSGGTRSIGNATFLSMDEFGLALSPTPAKHRTALGRSQSVMERAWAEGSRIPQSPSSSSSSSSSSSAIEPKGQSVIPHFLEAVSPPRTPISSRKRLPSILAAPPGVSPSPAGADTTTTGALQGKNGSKSDAVCTQASRSLERLSALLLTAAGGAEGTGSGVNTKALSTLLVAIPIVAEAITALQRALAESSHEAEVKCRGLREALNNREGELVALRGHCDSIEYDLANCQAESRAGEERMRAVQRAEAGEEELIKLRSRETRAKGLLLLTMTQGVVRSLQGYRTSASAAVSTWRSLVAGRRSLKHLSSIERLSRGVLRMERCFQHKSSLMWAMRAWRGGVLASRLVETVEDWELTRERERELSIRKAGQEEGEDEGDFILSPSSMGSTTPFKNSSSSKRASFPPRQVAISAAFVSLTGGTSFPEQQQSLEDRVELEAKIQLYQEECSKLLEKQNDHKDIITKLEQKILEQEMRLRDSQKEAESTLSALRAIQRSSTQSTQTAASASVATLMKKLDDALEETFTLKTKKLDLEVKVEYLERQIDSVKDDGMQQIARLMESWNCDKVKYEELSRVLEENRRHLDTACLKLSNAEKEALMWKSSHEETQKSISLQRAATSTMRDSYSPKSTLDVHERALLKGRAVKAEQLLAAAQAKVEASTLQAAESHIRAITAEKEANASQLEKVSLERLLETSKIESESNFSRAFKEAEEHLALRLKISSPERIEHSPPSPLFSSSSLKQLKGSEISDSPVPKSSLFSHLSTSISESAPVPSSIPSDISDKVSDQLEMARKVLAVASSDLLKLSVGNELAPISTFHQNLTPTPITSLPTHSQSLPSKVLPLFSSKILAPPNVSSYKPAATTFASSSNPFISRPTIPAPHAPLALAFVPDATLPSSIPSEQVTPVTLFSQYSSQLSSSSATRLLLERARATIKPPPVASSPALAFPAWGSAPRFQPPPSSSVYLESGDDDDEGVSLSHARL